MVASEKKCLLSVDLSLVLQYLALPCGLIRGALANLGIVCIVTAEVNVMPACESTFHFISLFFVVNDAH
jgi:Transport protein particle (TRAPP) component